MVRDPTSLIAYRSQSQWLIDRRDFLRQCGAAAIATASLAACSSGRDIVQAVLPSTGFFADGTDFAE